MTNHLETETPLEQPIPVSALLPVKNGMKFIFSAKQQISNTCRAYDEILVVDDNSTDGTFRELQRWAAEDSRVRVLSNAGQGLVSALNLGVAESTNSWVARFDVDDKYREDRLKQQITLVNLETVAIFSDYEIWQPDGISVGKIPSPVDSDAVKISLVNSRRTAHPSVLFSKDAVLEVGGYIAEDFPAEDLSLWLRLSRVGKLSSVPQVLLNYQLGLSSISGQQRALIIRRTSDLLHQIGVHDVAIKSGFERVDEILDTYSDLNLTKEREILFLQELSKALEISGENKRLAILTKLAKRLDKNMVNAALNISIGAARRRIYRKLG